MDVDGVYFFICWGKHRQANGDGSCASWAGSQRIGVGLVGACMTRDKGRFTVCGGLSLFFFVLGGGMSLHASPQMGDEFRVQALE
ncbi:hypothetical protein J3E69DRAFT_322332 [Trichoderma sp. SZMC 28015]